MIASENFVSEAVLEAAGSVFTNKYAEGYPETGVLRRLRIRRCGGEPGARSGETDFWRSSMPMCSRIQGRRPMRRPTWRCCSPAIRFSDLDLAHGGHLTHGHKLSFSGKLYRTTFYTVRKDTEHIDYDELEAIAEREKPKVLIGGGSAYPRLWDFARMRQIADKVGRDIHLRHGAYRRIGGGRRRILRRCLMRTLPRQRRTRLCAGRGPD